MSVINKKHIVGVARLAVIVTVFMLMPIAYKVHEMVNVIETIQQEITDDIGKNICAKDDNEYVESIDKPRLYGYYDTGRGLRGLVNKRCVELYGAANFVTVSIADARYKNQKWRVIKEQIPSLVLLLVFHL